MGTDTRDSWHDVQVAHYFHHEICAALLCALLLLALLLTRGAPHRRRLEVCLGMLVCAHPLFYEPIPNVDYPKGPTTAREAAGRAAVAVARLTAQMTSALGTVCVMPRGPSILSHAGQLPVLPYLLHAFTMPWCAPAHPTKRWRANNRHRCFGPRASHRIAYKEAPQELEPPDIGA